MVCNFVEPQIWFYKTADQKDHGPISKTCLTVVFVLTVRVSIFHSTANQKQIMQNENLLKTEAPVTTGHTSNSYHEKLCGTWTKETTEVNLIKEYRISAVYTVHLFSVNKGALHVALCTNGVIFSQNTWISDKLSTTHVSTALTHQT